MNKNNQVEQNIKTCNLISQNMVQALSHIKKKKKLLRNTQNLKLILCMLIIQNNTNKIILNYIEFIFIY